MVSNDDAVSISDIICKLQHDLLALYPESLLFGLGVNDPKRVFGTTNNLVEVFGENRVFETPTAENCSLGIAVGLAISGHKPIVVHQRLDFFLLAMDQLVNSAAKWRYMFGDAYETAMIIRLIVGRGWGQGPTHSQNLHSWFAHIPNLRVCFPAFAEDFQRAFELAFREPYPLIIIEDRWVHQSIGTSKKSKQENCYKARIISKGDDISLVTFGYNSILALKVIEFYKNKGIHIEHIDLFSLKPIDLETLYLSVKKTGRMVIVDSGFEIASIASYISHKLTEMCFGDLLGPIRILTAGDYAEPTSYGVIDEVKVNAERIARAIGMELGLDDIKDFTLFKSVPVDVPNPTFQGPF